MRSEEEILDRIGRLVKIPRASQIKVGIGDDCAILRPRGSSEDLLFTTDMLLEDVHLRRSSHTPEAIGHKALARGLSDIAAMGGEPRFCLLSLAVPMWADARWLQRFYRGFMRLAGRTGTPLAGGDLARAERLVCDIIVCGAAPGGTALLRSGAKPGDRVYVSGTLGGSALGLRMQAGKAWRRHSRPEPRLRLGRFLREKLRASAAIDLSDGLSLDLHRLCVASRVSAAIEAPPVFPGATIEDALHGGEDYELLFTAPAGTRVPRDFKGLALSCIGVVEKGKVGAVYLAGLRLAQLGFDHFRGARQYAKAGRERRARSSGTALR